MCNSFMTGFSGGSGLCRLEAMIHHYGAFLLIEDKNHEMSKFGFTRDAARI